ncbi:MAG: OmpA family protein [Candidatus Dadabacteria bacterium]|nr:OmpA family protein [Candidatus Dadabacteria bacterium]
MLRAGGADTDGSASKRRAQAVANALINDYGIQRKRIEHWGVGYLAPVASNRTEEGRAKNRRVVLVE